METKKHTISKEFGENWIKELEKNKIPKTKGIFYSKNTDGVDCYCANGVGYIANGFYFDEKGFLIKDGKKYSAWGTGSQSPIPTRLIDEVVYLNDDLNMPFPKIAEWIKNNVELV